MYWPAQEHGPEPSQAHEAALAALRSCAALARSAHLPPAHHERASNAADTEALLGYLLSAAPGEHDDFC